jgi:hypothetical protein
MKAAEAFRQLEADADLLKTISETYPATSAEVDALRRAATALTYVVMHDRERFATFIEVRDRDLSAEERAELRDRCGNET